MSRFKLEARPAGLSLVDRYSEQPPLCLAFDAPGFRRRLKQASPQKELLARAVKPSPGLAVLDCTGGLGRDAFLLAHLGCQVTLCERSRTVHALLADALQRAGRHPELAATAARISLRCQDSLELLQARPGHAVIYLDPMFPPRRKAARVKGAMQRLQRFLGEEPDWPRLCSAALRQSAAGLVLKRPASARGPSLSSACGWPPPIKPNHTLKSRNAQYLVFIPPG